MIFVTPFFILAILLKEVNHHILNMNILSGHTCQFVVQLFCPFFQTKL